MFFKKKRSNNVIEVMEFSGMHVSTGQVSRYIDKVCDEEGFSYIYYDYRNVDGILRFVITTIPSNKKAIQYFKDRCAAMVEEECRKIDIAETA